MTELEQKAEEYFSHHNFALHNRYGVQKDIHRMIYKDGYAQGQQELMASNDVIKRGFADNLEKENAELKEENEELKEKNKILEKDLQTAIETNRLWLKRDTALEEQIEKMASCTNCSNYDGDNYCKVKCKIIHNLTGSCSEWRVAE